jgi:SPP1 family predicted phage head-tail adaptor
VKTTINALRQRVTLQDYTSPKNALGQVRPAWTDVATYCAEVVQLSGRELTNALQRKPEVSVRVTMRYVPGVKPSQRFTFGDRVLTITWTDNEDNRCRWLHCYCEEKVTPP